jgi:Na+-driven multidrug efflux pump
MVVAAGVLTVLAPSLVALFDPTPQVVALGTEYLQVVAWSEVASAVGVVLAQALAGAGNTVPAMGINLFSLWGLEVAVALGLSRWLGLGITGVWWGRTLANLINGFLFALWFRRGVWKQKDV